MRRVLGSTLAALGLLLTTPPSATAQDAAPAAQAAGEGRLFELRVYYPSEGKLDALHDRFRRHTSRLFSRHGIADLAYFTARDEAGTDRLVYLLAYPNRAARDAAWAGLVTDPDWQRAKRTSDRDGRLVEKVQEYLMTPTSECPPVRPAKSDDGGKFELVTHAAAGNGAAAHRRLRDEHPGTELLGSWTLDARPGAPTLVHLIRKMPPAPREEIVLASTGRDLPGIAKLRSAPEAEPTARPGFGRLPLTPTAYSPLR